MISLLNPDPNLIKIEDIAHALSHICRFTGHVSEFYSVLNHVINCYFLALDHYPDNPRIQYGALMHDCAEAYIGDVSSPLKQNIPDYKTIEKNFDGVIENKFNVVLNEEERQAVKLIDLSMLFIEADYLFPTKTEGWSIDRSNLLSFKKYDFCFFNINQIKTLREKFVYIYFVHNVLKKLP